MLKTAKGLERWLAGAKTSKPFWRAKDVHNLNLAIVVLLMQRNPYSCDL